MQVFRLRGAQVFCTRSATILKLQFLYSIGARSVHTRVPSPPRCAADPASQRSAVAGRLLRTSSRQAPSRRRNSFPHVPPSFFLLIPYCIGSVRMIPMAKHARRSIFTSAWPPSNGICARGPRGPVRPAGRRRRLVRQKPVSQNLALPDFVRICRTMSDFGSDFVRLRQALSKGFKFSKRFKRLSVS